jgi:hypothetical protein
MTLLKKIAVAVGYGGSNENMFLVVSGRCVRKSPEVASYFVYAFDNGCVIEITDKCMIIDISMSTGLACCVVEVFRVDDKDTSMNVYSTRIDMFLK